MAGNADGVALTTDGNITGFLGGGPVVPAVADVGGKVIVVTTGGSGVITNDYLFIHAMWWDAEGQANENLTVTDRNDKTQWTAETTAENTNIKNPLPGIHEQDGLKVVTLTAGTLYIYLK